VKSDLLSHQESSHLASVYVHVPSVGVLPLHLPLVLKCDKMAILSLKIVYRCENTATHKKCYVGNSLMQKYNARVDNIVIKNFM
jgi:hypothetical protein